MTHDEPSCSQRRHAEVFEAHRSLLLGLAYRLLGSMWDAEDVVQDAYLRWLRVGLDEVREPRAFLVTLTSRLALDQLKSARKQRETYPGPWLPEPVPDSALGPLETVELRDTVSFATLHLMERLSAPQRAVYVLREAFGLPYDQIAEVVGASVAGCRQMHKRGRDRLAAGAAPYAPDPVEHRRLVSRFLQAAASGDISALEQLLADDVAVWNDGGGRVRAARRPVRGRTAAVAFLRGLIDRYPLDGADIVDANGAAGALLRMGGTPQYVAVHTQGGRIQQLFAVLNPDKLTGMIDHQETPS